MKKGLAVLLLIVFTAVMAAGCSNSPKIAYVNGEPITKEALDKRTSLMIDQFNRAYGLNVDPKKDKELYAEAQKQALESLIDEKVQIMEANRRHIKPDADEVKSNLESVKAAMGGKSGYEEYLKQVGLTEKDVKEILENQSRIDQLREQVTKNVKVSAKEAEAYFNSHPGRYDAPAEVRVSHILVKTEKEAQEIIAELKKGADFAALAKSKSIDTASAKDGGDLGWISEKSNLVPEFLTAALALKKGQYTDNPVKSEYGYHVIKCFDEHPAEKATFQQVAAQVTKDALEDKKDKSYDTFRQNLRKKAEVKILDDSLKEEKRSSGTKPNDKK